MPRHHFVPLVVATLVCLLWLWGCAPSGHWVKPGATPQEFVEASAACTRQARQGGYLGHGYIGPRDVDFYYALCLRARGYSLVQQP